MYKRYRATRISIVSVGLCVAFVTLVVARSPIASAGSLQGAIVTSPNTSATQNNYLNSVTCVSASDCWAVGYYYTGLYEQTLIEQYNGTSWSIVTSANASTLDSNYLSGVTCVSASDCWAVGYYVSVSFDQTLIEQYNGTSWSIVTSPNTSMTQSNDLYGVTCVSPSDCWADGEYIPGSYDQTLVEEWNGTSWSIVSSPNTSTTQHNVLYGVTCVSASDCWADGEYINAGSYYQTLVEEWNGTSWSIVSSPNTSTTASNYLAGVSCTSGTFCMATGWYVSPTPSYHQTLIEQWNGTSWSIVTSQNTSTTVENNLVGVSCTNATSCMAIGNYWTGSNNQTLAEEWNGTSWSIVSSPNTSPTQNNYLPSVSCVSASDCWAVGYYTNSGGYEQTLIEQFTMVCSGGSLELTAPTSAPFPGITLNGTNQTSAVPVTFTPDDETGTGSGWNVAITSTTLTDSGGQTLPTTATTVTGVASVVADLGNCSLPTNTVAGYPITVPAAATPPTAIPFYSANTGTGEGPSDVTLDFAIGVPANAHAATYSSTWTVTIASGP